MRSPVLGAACGAGLATLLAARLRLHRFATHWLSQAELHDGLLLAALALFALPLVPATPIAALGGVVLRPVAVLVVLVLVPQAIAHVALRFLGARGGLLRVGFVSGFMSSTASVDTMGRRALAQPALARACAAGAAMSGAATWVLALAVVGALAPDAVGWILSGALAGTVAAAVTAWWPVRRRDLDPTGAPATPSTDARVEAPGVSSPAPRQRPARGPLRLREALVLAALPVGIAAAVAVLARWMGPQAALPGAALAALAEAHAAIAALATLVQAGALPGTMLAPGQAAGRGNEHGHAHRRRCRQRWHGLRSPRGGFVACEPCCGARCHDRAADSLGCRMTSQDCTSLKAPEDACPHHPRAAAAIGGLDHRGRRLLERRDNRRP